VAAVTEPRYAWVIVGAAFFSLAIIFGVSYSFAAFFESFAAEFAAERADVSWIFGICGLTYFVLGAAAGVLTDRFGPRIVCGSGMVLIAAGLWWTSLAQVLSTVYLSYGLMVGLGIALVYTPAISSVQPWFSARRGLAAGIASSGVGAGTLVVPMLIAALLADQPWRYTMRELAAGVLLAGLFTTFWLKRPPPLGQSGNDIRPGVSLREALTGKPFWWLYLGTVLAAPTMFIPFSHLSPAARDLGIDQAHSVGLVGIIGIGSLIGRFGVGSLADRIGRIPALCWMQLSMGCTFVAWAFGASYAGLVFFAFWFGLSYGGIVSLLPAICMDLFGARSISGILGTLYSGAALGNLLGPVLAGAVFDLTQSYQPVIWSCLGLSTVATLTSLRLKRFEGNPY
jgi:MFS family permease